MRNHCAVAYLLLAGTLMAASACGSGLVPVEGKVTLDGEPVSGATVMFVTEDQGRRGLVQPTGATDAEGRFFLTTKTDRGALPGKYKVAVSKMWVARPGGAKPPQTPPPQRPAPANTPRTREVMPSIYASPQTTPCRFDVPKGGTKNAEIALGRNPKLAKPEGE